MTLKVAFVIFFYWSPAEYQPIQIWTDLCPQKEGKQQQWQWIGEARHQLFQIRADGYSQEQQYESSGHKTRWSSKYQYIMDHHTIIKISWIIVSWISWFIIQHVEDFSLDRNQANISHISWRKTNYGYKIWIQIWKQIWISLDPNRRANMIQI